MQNRFRSGYPFQSETIARERVQVIGLGVRILGVLEALPLPDLLNLRRRVLGLIFF